MKNFRKVLALVLVVATLFSFTAMTSAVNIGEYEDWSKVSYAEAVDVLSAVGILNGYEDDTFKPTNTISREEMAKMIATMANAGDDVSTLYASASTFADVPAAKWSASYVAYCAKTGIVAGRSATTFDPSGKVTGLETAKMLLVVLGFDAEEQGYVGADWKVNVLRDAKVMGLTNNFAADYDIDAAITREEAAQMMLNALEAPCVVGVISDGLVTVTNALIVNWKTPSDISELLKVTAYAKLKDAMDAGKWCLYGNVLISNDTLWNRLYNGLTKDVANEDCYGRPATVWTYTDSKGNVETLALSTATPVWTSTNATPNAIDAKVAEYAKVAKVAAQYVDGEEGKTVDGGKGALVEMYVIGDKITLVEVNTYIGKVGQLNTAKGTFQIVDMAEKPNTVVAKAENDYGFEVEDEGTVILYWLCGDKDGVHTVKVAESEVVELHGVLADVKNPYFCDTAENKYYYSVNNEAGEVSSATLTKKELVVYTDAYGYVLYWKPVTAASGIAVMVADSATRTLVNETTTSGKTYTYAADFVDFEDAPAAETVVTNETTWDNADVYEEEMGVTSDVLVKYTVSGDKRNSAVAVGTATNVPYILSASGKISTEADADGKSTTLGYAANNNTQYLLRVWNYAEGAYEYKYFDGKSEVDGAYKLDNLQYLTEGSYLTYVYAEAEWAKSASLAFVMSYAGMESYKTQLEIGTAANYEEYYLYKAIVDGEEAYVAYESKLDNNNLMKVYKSKYVLINAKSHDGLDVYMAVAAVSNAGSDFVVEGDTLVWKNTAAGMEIADMAEDATILVIEQFNTADNYGDYAKGTVIYTAVEDYSDVVDYLTGENGHGWKNGYSYVGYNAAGEVNLLYIYAIVE